MQWYTENTLYDTLLLVGFAYAILVMVSSYFGTAAYGGRFGHLWRKDRAFLRGQDVPAQTGHEPKPQLGAKLVLQVCPEE